MLVLSLIVDITESLWYRYMTRNSPSSTTSPQPPRRRRPQTRLGNDSSAVLVDLRLPAAAKRRRLTLASVSAVCEQQGEHVSTRNVQRRLGGSLRDIGPLVQAWRDNRATAGVTAAAGDQAQALGAILIGALQDQSAAIAAALERQAQATAVSQRDLLDRVEHLIGDRVRELAKAALAGTSSGRREATDAGGEVQGLRRDLQALHADVDRALARPAGMPPATTQDLVDLGQRIDRLTQGLAPLQTEVHVPAASDLDALLAPVIARLDELSTDLAAIAAAAPADAASTHPTLDRIEAHLVALATPKPPTRAQPSKAILSRLDALLVATADLPVRIKSTLAPAKRKRKTAAPKKAVKKSAKKTTAKTKIATKPVRRKSTRAAKAVPAISRKPRAKKMDAASARRKATQPKSVSKRTSNATRPATSTRSKANASHLRKGAQKRKIRTLPEKKGHQRKAKRIR